MKEKIIYQLKYKGKTWLRRENWPVFNHLHPGFEVYETRLIASGKVTLDGKELEFNDIRVYLNETGN